MTKEEARRLLKPDLSIPEMRRIYAQHFGARPFLSSARKKTIARGFREKLRKIIEEAP